MEEFAELLAAIDGGDLSNLTDEQLALLEPQLISYGRSLKSANPTDQDIADAQTVANALTVVREEIARRAEAAAERAQQAEEAFAPFDEPETEEVVEEPAPEPAPVRASIAELGRRRPRSAEPIVQPAQAIVAAALEGEGQMGTRFNDRFSAAEAMINARQRMADGERTVLRIPMETKHNMPGTDPWSNWAVLDQVRKESMAARDNGVGLTAALGCAPVQPVYDFFDPSSRIAGILDLPDVGAPRGARSFPPPLSFADVEGAGTLWDGGTKTCFTIPCMPQDECQVEVTYTCMTFQNDQQFYFPEQVAAFQSLALTVHDHNVNRRAIEQIRDAANTITVQDLDTGGGTVVSLLRAIGRARAHYIQKHKMPESTTVDVLAPYWLGASYAADIVARQSTDMGQGAIDFGMARINSELRSLGINIQWLYDWQEAAAEAFDSFASLLMFVPGAVVRLRGASLDLGVVRDSILNAANDFQIFVETSERACVIFEAMYIQGVESCPTGETGAAGTVACAAS